MIEGNTPNASAADMSAKALDRMMRGLSGDSEADRLAGIAGLADEMLTFKSPLTLLMHFPNIVELLNKGFQESGPFRDAVDALVSHFADLADEVKADVETINDMARGR